MGSADEETTTLSGNDIDWNLDLVGSLESTRRQKGKKLVSLSGFFVCSFVIMCSQNVSPFLRSAKVWWTGGIRVLRPNGIFEIGNALKHCPQCQQEENEISAWKPFDPVTPKAEIQYNCPKYVYVFLGCHFLEEIFRVGF